VRNLRTSTDWLLVYEDPQAQVYRRKSRVAPTTPSTATPAAPAVAAPPVAEKPKS